MSTLKKIALIGGIIGLSMAGVAEANTVYNAPALFETSLATAITANATSATLSYGVLRDGTLLSGPVCFTIDSGLSTTEFVCGNASGTVITNLIRGMGEDGSSTYPAISYPHRYGADVKVTDFPVLQQLLNFVQGLFSFPNVLSYAPGITTSTIASNALNIPDVQYVNSVAVAGAPNASLSVKGISQLSTQAQMAAGTALGSTGASLVDQTANDSLVASTSPIDVIASGTLDPSFLLNGNYALGSTTIATATLNGVVLPNNTSSLLSTNSSGTLLGISASPSGNILVASGTQWVSATSSAVFPYYVSSTIVYNGGGSTTGSTSTASTTFNLKYSGRVLAIYNGTAQNNADNDRCSMTENINGTQDGGILSEIVNGSGALISGLTSVGFSHISTVLLPSGTSSISIVITANAGTCTFDPGALGLQVEYIGQ